MLMPLYATKAIDEVEMSRRKAPVEHANLQDCYHTQSKSALRALSRNQSSRYRPNQSLAQVNVYLK